MRVIRSENLMLKNQKVITDLPCVSSWLIGSFSSQRRIP
ncbi:hypothetical protein N646_4043 [Vibrio alginolyticus NBRC 15630 = ATCC 17749]|uniref:Uncharacterized protein n=1 Tax=Vibrio alginolyticus (strain ATCC 17749 / DSM 2171 / NBRC 15630 / NCIMB 1903 / NCTC 12160 / XII-53) TaxID=1219076 RepID=A0A2I3CQ47_VIBAX|nr:hypothetical protein N646_4043 [Vibrio alginolyticus NBRC 15630 = ATCC 17749]